MKKQTDQRVRGVGGGAINEAKQNQTYGDGRRIDSRW